MGVFMKEGSLSLLDKINSAIATLKRLKEESESKKSKKKGFERRQEEFIQLCLLRNFFQVLYSFYLEKKAKQQALVNLIFTYKDALEKMIKDQAFHTIKKNSLLAKLSLVDLKLLEDALKNDSNIHKLIEDHRHEIYTPALKIKDEKNKEEMSLIKIAHDKRSGSQIENQRSELESVIENQQLRDQDGLAFKLEKTKEDELSSLFNSLGKSWLSSELNDFLASETEEESECLAFEECFTDVHDADLAFLDRRLAYCDQILQDAQNKSHLQASFDEQLELIKDQEERDYKLAYISQALLNARFRGIPSYSDKIADAYCNLILTLKKDNLDKAFDFRRQPEKLIGYLEHLFGSLPEIEIPHEDLHYDRDHKLAQIAQALLNARDEVPNYNEEKANEYCDFILTLPMTRLDELVELVPQVTRLIASLEDLKNSSLAQSLAQNEIYIRDKFVAKILSTGYFDETASDFIFTLNSNQLEELLSLLHCAQKMEQKLSAFKTVDCNQSNLKSEKRMSKESSHANDFFSQASQKDLSEDLSSFIFSRVIKGY